MLKSRLLNLSENFNISRNQQKDFQYKIPKVKEYWTFKDINEKRKYKYPLDYLHNANEKEDIERIKKVNQIIWRKRK